MVLYVCSVCMNNQPAFEFLIKKNKAFREKPAWHVVLSQYNIFEKLQKRLPYSSERTQLDVIALKIALERELTFMQDLILENIVMTQDVIAALASEKQHRLLIDMLTKPIRPLFSPSSFDNQKPFSANKKRSVQPGKPEKPEKKDVNDEEKPLSKPRISMSKLERIAAPLQTERALTFTDILESCINARIKSLDLINLL